MEQNQQPLEVVPALNRWVRSALLIMAVGLVAVFALAAWLRPYDRQGQPLRMETHRQLGLPPCTFYQLTGLPCPSCGMTTSFALLLHGDVWHSLQANAVGTLLALFCLGLVPWNLACALRGRLFFIWSLDRALIRVIAVFLVLVLARWAIVLALSWGGRHAAPPTGKQGMLPGGITEERRWRHAGSSGSCPA